MANRRGTPESLGVTPLAEGEHSRPVRVRAEAWVFEALKGRSAAEVGALSERVYKGSGRWDALRCETQSLPNRPDPKAV